MLLEQIVKAAEGQQNIWIGCNNFAVRYLVESAYCAIATKRNLSPAQKSSLLPLYEERTPLRPPIRKLSEAVELPRVRYLTRQAAFGVICLDDAVKFKPTIVGWVAEQMKSGMAPAMLVCGSNYCPQSQCTGPLAEREFRQMIEKRIKELEVTFTIVSIPGMLTMAEYASLRDLARGVGR